MHPTKKSAMKKSTKEPVIKRNAARREMRTPISYYGGKQQMLRHILPKIPEHKIYVEPFFGGGAVFWGKTPSAAEVVNDINHRLTTFYKVLKYDFDDFIQKADETFHSRAQHKESDELYQSQLDEITDPVACAWAGCGCRRICRSAQ